MNIVLTILAVLLGSLAGVAAYRLCCCSAACAFRREIRQLETILAGLEVAYRIKRFTLEAEYELAARARLAREEPLELVRADGG